MDPKKDKVPYSIADHKFFAVSLWQLCEHFAVKLRDKYILFE